MNTHSSAFFYFCPPAFRIICILRSNGLREKRGNLSIEKSVKRIFRNPGKDVDKYMCVLIY